MYPVQNVTHVRAVPTPRTLKNEVGAITALMFSPSSWLTARESLNDMVEAKPLSLRCLQNGAESKQKPNAASRSRDRPTSSTGEITESVKLAVELTNDAYC